MSTLTIIVCTIAAAQAQTSVCSNLCGHANDGLCDDGGPNAVYSICDPATDCTDCGPRTSLACSPTCFEYMWDDRKCDEGCNTFECGHNDCAEMEIIEHCLMSVPTLMRQSEAEAALGAAAASTAADRVQDVALQVQLEPFNVQIDEATKESILEVKLRVKLEWDDRRPAHRTYRPPHRHFLLAPTSPVSSSRHTLLSF